MTRIKADVDALAGVPSRTAYHDGWMPGAAAVVAETLTALGGANDGFPTPSPELANHIRDHTEKVRVLADVFGLVANRIRHAGEIGQLPNPWDPAGGDSGLSSSKENRRWLEAHLAAAHLALDGELARQVARTIREALNLGLPPVHVVATRETRTTVRAALVASGSVTIVWTITELSDGTAVVTLRYEDGVGVEAGLGASAQVECGGLDTGAGVGFGASVAGLTDQTWSKQFPDGRAAARFVADQNLAAFADRARSLVPGLGWLAQAINLNPMANATVRGGGEALTTEASASVSAELVGAGAALGAAMTAGFRAESSRDRRTGETTSTLSLDATAGAASAVTGLVGAVDVARHVEAGVTRNAAGTVTKLTIRVDFDDQPGLTPSLSSKSLDANGNATTGGSELHRYRVDVTVDLTDPRNEALADAFGKPGDTLTDARIALSHADAFDADVLARSKVSVIEQVVGGESCAIGVDAEALAEVGLTAGTSTTTTQTVAAWSMVGGTLRRMPAPG